MLNNSCELLYALKKMGYLKSDRDPIWWPNSGTEEVILGAILTQQTRWEKVEESLANLQKAGLDNMESLADTDTKIIATLIKPSGFYNTKAQRLKLLCKHILEDFDSFEVFQESVDREWLLDQKGIGMESADSILCYGCRKEAFVVDSYTSRLLEAFGYCFESYGEMQEWIINGLEENLVKVHALYGREVPRYELYARFHGKIVEFSKEFMRGKQVDLSHLIQFLDER
ncbi:MAG: 3-methyladenine DNA glycosylase [Campylobacterota bacterium]|nr:3-methyladenine DNA glycosylase [Campylobacterota bacterium]